MSFIQEVSDTLGRIITAGFLTTKLHAANHVALLQYAETAFPGFSDKIRVALFPVAKILDRGAGSRSPGSCSQLSGNSSPERGGSPPVRPISRSNAAQSARPRRSSK